MPILQYNIDTKIAYFKIPTKILKAFCEELYKYDSKSMCFYLDKTHKICYTNKNTSKIQVRNFEYIIERHNYSKKGFYGCFPTSFSYSGKGIDLSDSEIKLMCAIICDGSYRKECTKSNSCIISVKKDRKKDEIRKILEDCNISYRELEFDSMPGYKRFCFNTPRREKEFGEYWYNCNQHQLQVICDNILFWDGHTRYTSNNYKICSFCSAVKQNADFVQFVFMACGYRASIGEHTRIRNRKNGKGESYSKKETSYVVNISNHNNPSLESQHKKDIISYEVEDNVKYCIESDDFIIYRKNGKIFIAKSN